MKRIKTMGLLLLTFCLMVVFTSGCKITKTENPNKPVAKVNGEAISRAEFNLRYNQVKDLLAQIYGEEALKTEQGKTALETVKANVLDDLIKDKVIAQKAGAEGVTVSEEEVNQRLAKDKESSTFAEDLKAQNMSEEDYKKVLRTELIKGKMKDKFTEQYKVTDQDVEKYYQQHPEEFGNLEQAKVRHILITPENKTDEGWKKAEQKTNDLLAELKSGADFTKLAKENSADTGSKEQGGELGLINPKTNFVPEFLDAVFKTDTPVGGFVIAKSTYGYHLINIEERVPSDIPPLAEIKKQVEEKAAAAKKEEVFEGLVAAWVQNAKVEKFIK